MKAIQRMKGKVFFLFVLIVCLCVCDIPVQAASNYTKKVTKKNADFTLSAEYGLGGLVYYEMPTVVNVTLECKENFTGTLRVIPEDGSLATVAYGMDISLSAGEPKTFQFVPSTITYNGRVLIEVLDEKGYILLNKRTCDDVMDLPVPGARPWSPADPYRHTLIVELEKDGEIWGIYFPCYELDTFRQATGLTE